MADQTSIIVGAGITAGGAFTLGHLVYVGQVSPAVLTSYGPKVVSDGLVVGITSFPDSAGGYNAIAGATEMVRIQGGLIVSGTGLDTVQIGRAASATQAGSVVIGVSASDAGQQGVYIGDGAVANKAAGVAIGVGATVAGNVASATGIAIGANATATDSAAGGGDSLAIGTGAVAHEGDVVIGGGASTNSTHAGNGNVVLGYQAFVNYSAGAAASTVLGASASAAGQWATVVGQGATSGTGVDNVVIGQVAKVTGAGANCVVIGQNSVASSSGQIIIGSDGVDGGANVCQIGTPGTPLVAVVFGRGVTIASPPAIIVQFTNGSGTDNAAGNLTIQAPLSTGAGTPATILFTVGHVGASSAALQTAATILTLGDGTASFGSNPVGMGALTAGTITSGLINGQTISSAANFTGTVAVTGTITSAIGSGSIFNIPNISSNNAYFHIGSSATDVYFGQASSAGVNPFSGTALLNNATFFGNKDNIPLQLVTSATPRLTIVGSGNVGIGTTGPTHLLEVNGTFLAAGAVTLSSTLNVSTLGAFAAGDKYVIANASGNFHLSALGPAS